MADAIGLIGGLIFLAVLVISDRREKDAAIAFHRKKMLEHDMKGETDLANYHLEQLVRNQSKRI